MAMRTAGVSVTVLALVLVARAAGPTDKPGGLLAPVRVGQKVGLKPDADGYVVTVVPGVDLGFTVTEVGPDYLVVVDAAGVNETRIPVYAIRAVKITRVPRGGAAGAPGPGR